MSLLDSICLPDGWEIHRLNRITTRSKVANHEEFPFLSVFLDAGVVPRASREDNFNRLGEDVSKYLLVKPGDIVFNKLRTWQGGFGASKFEGVVSPAYFVCRPGPFVVPRFVDYLLHSYPYLAELTRISKFMPPSQFDILWDDLKNLPIILPPKELQSEIADYLDQETQRLDALIAEKQRMLELLSERIDSLVMQKIGESRLGTTEGGGPMTSIKRILHKQKRPPKEDGEMITAYRDGQVTARTKRRAIGYTESAEKASNVQGVVAGDVVIHGLDGFAGAIGSAEVDGVCSPVYHVCQTASNSDSDCISRLLRILAVTGYLQTFTSSTRERAFDFRNWELFGSIQIPLLSCEEQARIGSQIRALRPLKEVVTASQLLAAEHRRTLITAVVTGQLDVPENAV